MRTRILLVLVPAVFLSIAPASAGAAGQPNDSSIDQYLPSIPGPGGDETFDDGANGGPSDGSTGGAGAPLPPSTSTDLNESGSSGAAVAALVEETAPAAAKPDAANAGEESGDPKDAGNSIADLASEAISGEGGMGLAFPLLLLGSLITAILLALARRRDRGDPVS